MGTENPTGKVKVEEVPREPRRILANLHPSVSMHPRDQLPRTPPKIEIVPTLHPDRCTSRPSLAQPWKRHLTLRTRSTRIMAETP